MMILKESCITAGRTGHPMCSSLIEIIGSAIAAARLVGLDHDGQRDAALAMLMVRDPSLTQGIARVLVDQLYAIGAADADTRLAA